MGSFATNGTMGPGTGMSIAVPPRPTFDDIGHRLLSSGYRHRRIGLENGQYQDIWIDPNGNRMSLQEARAQLEPGTDTQPQSSSTEPSRVAAVRLETQPWTGPPGLSSANATDCSSGSCPTPGNSRPPDPTPGPPVVPEPPVSPVSPPSQPSGGGGCGCGTNCACGGSSDCDCGDGMAAIRQQIEQIGLLLQQLAENAGNGDSHSDQYLLQIIDNQTNLLGALTNIANAMEGMGGSDADSHRNIEIAIQRLDGSVTKLAKEVELLAKDQDTLLTSNRELVLAVQQNRDAIATANSSVVNLGRKVDEVASRQTDFENRLRDLSIQLDRIQKGEFKFSLSIDPKTGKVIDFKSQESGK